MIKDSIEKLGFKYADTKILLISHAHFDHDAGSAQIVKETGAKYEVMDCRRGGGGVGRQDRLQLWRHRTGITRAIRRSRWPACCMTATRSALGGTVLTAHKTPGHTKGCTTWTLKVKDGGKDLDVVIVGSPNVNPGYVLVGNAKYPKSCRTMSRPSKC